MAENGKRGQSNLLQWLGQVPGVLHFAALFYCMLDPETPMKVRACVLFALVYLILPIDLIPDVLLLVFGLGVVDDVAVVYMAYKMAEGHILPRHRSQARAFFHLPEEDLPEQ